MDQLQQAKQVIAIEIQALREVQSRLDHSFLAALKLLLDTVQRGRKILVTGIGKSGHIGHKIAATLSSTGAPSVVLDTVNAAHGDLGMATEGDALIALSYSGETEELVRILPFLKRLPIPIIALTGQPKSTLGSHATVILDVSVSQEACPLNLAPTSSTTAMLAIGDALAMVLLQARGFREEDFARFHPGGSLGKRLLLRVGDVMRPAASLALLPGTATVHEAIRAWNQKRTGAAVVVNKTGQLVGIFTHGDFVRRYEKEPEIGNCTLREVMTRRPVTVHVDKLAVEVLNLFETYRIDDLVVVDEKKRPVGLIDAQDLTKTKLI
jgi:arabinose-5-phosphate isomerase